MIKIILSLLISLNAVLLTISVVSWNLYIGCFALVMSLVLTKLINRNSKTL